MAVGAAAACAAPGAAQVAASGGTSSPPTSPSAATATTPANAPNPAAQSPGRFDAGATFPALPASLALTTPGAASIRPLLTEAVALAVRRNPGLLGTLRDVFAARAQVRSAQVLAPPSFIVAPAITPGGTSDAFIYLQPLELNGTRTARTRVARAGLTLAQAQALLQLQSLVYQVRVNYYTLARAQEQLALAREQLAVAQQIDDAARRQVELGARPGIERVQTAIEVERARLLAAQAEGEEQAARAGFNGYLGRAPFDPVAPLESLAAIEQSVTTLANASASAPASTPAPAALRGEIGTAGVNKDAGKNASDKTAPLPAGPGTPNAAVPPPEAPGKSSPPSAAIGTAQTPGVAASDLAAAAPPDLAAAQRQALAQRGEIAIATANRDTQARQAELDRAQGRPDLALQLRAGEIARGIHDAGIGAVFTIPLDYGTRRERIRQETLSVEAETDRLAGVQGQVRLEVLQSAARAQAALAGLRVYNGSLLADARTLLDASRFGFNEGKTTILAVLEAQRAYRAIAAGRINALISFAEAQSSLDRATGTLPPNLLAALQSDFLRPALSQASTVNAAEVPVPSPTAPVSTSTTSSTTSTTLPAQTAGQKRGHK